MSQIEGIARSVAWGAGFAALGMGTGVLVDGILGRRLSTVTKDCTVKVFSQLVIGLAVLSEAIAIIMPADVVAPLSDGMMFYWFFESQPVLKGNVSRMLHSWSSLLFPGVPPVPAASISPASPPMPAASISPASPPMADAASQPASIQVSPVSKASAPVQQSDLGAILAGFVDPMNPGRPYAGAF